MHTLALFTFLSGALASPFLGLGSSKSSDSGSGIPPKYIRDQFPQFSEAQWEKYHCFSYADLFEIVPPCSDYCEQHTFGELSPGGVARDGCHPDDFPCHCARSQVVTNIIEPCILPFKNHSATCTLPQLGILQAFVTDSCAFFNATQYADYNSCSKTINNGIIADIIAGTAPRPSSLFQVFNPLSFW